jgi:uncharacterized protein
MIPRLIPIFPLPNVVHFPLAPLPLHIFEPRYRKMVKDAMEGARTIGMTLLKPGWEDDYEGRPPVYEHGCAGVIDRCEPTPQGRYNILLRGVVRFRILEEHAGEPYRLATVEPIPDLPGEPAELGDLRRRVLAAIGSAKDGPSLLVQGDVPDDLFVNVLSQSLPLRPLERQSLLDCGGIGERYLRLLEILQFHELEQSAAMRGMPPSDRTH